MKINKQTVVKCTTYGALCVGIVCDIIGAGFLMMITGIIIYGQIFVKYSPISIPFITVGILYTGIMCFIIGYYIEELNIIK